MREGEADCEPIYSPALLFQLNQIQKEAEAINAGTSFAERIEAKRLNDVATHGQLLRF